MAVRDRKREDFKTNKLYSNYITQKEFGAGDNNGRDSALWKNREKDWYNAERRFIFATRTIEERN